MLAVSVLAVVVVFLAYKLWSGRAQRRALRGYQQLLGIAMGDQEVVERLIALEETRHPGASRETLIRHAIERWRRDNR